MLEGLLIGLETAFSLKNLLMVIGGCLIGTFIGMLPGLGPMSIIAIMIPVAITLGDPAAALILLAGVYYGAIFGGSTSSILLNVLTSLTNPDFHLGWSRLISIGKTCFEISEVILRTLSSYQLISTSRAL